MSHDLQQENFCLEYVKCGNAYKAMVAAGYSESTARADSARLLSYPDVQERLQELQHSIAQAAEVTTLMIVLELKKIAFASIGDLGGVMNLKDYDALPADAKAGIAGNPARPAAQTPPPAQPSALLPRRNRSNDPRANPYYTHRRSDMFNTRHPRHVG